MWASIFLGIVFFLLGSVHLYWAFGGLIFLENTLPTDTHHQLLFKPGRLAFVLVIVGLYSFSAIYFLKAGVIYSKIFSNQIDYAGWLIPVIFLLRGIGEFKYVGLFKKVKNTSFARNDTKYYTPLCFILFLLGVFIQLKWL